MSIPEHTLTALTDEADLEAEGRERGNATRAPSRAYPRLRPREKERYEVIGEHGRGGIGRVLRAQDRDLKRTVAIKELLRTDRKTEHRFVREAMITAVLQHPGIVPVLEAGHWSDGTPFYAMKLVEGESMKERLSACGSRRERLELVPNLLAVADAIAYAHSRGVIHRDLKPSNIVIGDYGETVVIDWGLAKFLEDEEIGPAAGPYRLPLCPDPLTIDGSILGTPAYMAPEQGQGGTVDRRADVYALGAITLELLTGSPPQHSTMAARQRAISPNVPGGEADELRAIAEKAADPNPERRYANAADLAEDLRRFLAGRLVRAYDYTRTDLLLRWVKRNRTAVLVATVGLLLTIIGGSYGLARVAQERDAALESGRRARLAELAAKDRADNLILLHAQRLLGSDPTKSLAWLKHYPADARNWPLAHKVAAEAHQKGFATRELQLRVPTVFTSLAEKSRALVIASKDKRLRSWRLEDGEVDVLASDVRHFGRVAVSPDGTLIAYELEAERALRVLLTGRETIEIPLVGPVADVTISDRGILAIGYSTGDVQLFDTGAGRRMAALHHPGRLHTAVVSNDGEWLVTGDAGGVTRVWRIQSGNLRESRHFDADACATRVDTDALYIGSCSGTLIALDLVTLEHREVASDSGSIFSIATSADGARLAWTGVDGSVWSQQRETGESERLHTHAGKGYSVAFSPDGEFLASGGDEGAIFLFHFPTGDRWRLLGHESPLYSAVQFTPDGRWLVSSDADGTSRLWRIPTASEAVLRGHSDSVLRLEWGQDGRQLTSSGRDGSIRQWDVAAQLSTWQFSKHGDLVSDFATFRHGREVVTASWDGAVRFLRDGTLLSLKQGKQKARVHSVAASNNGDLIASGGGDGILRLWTSAGSSLAEIETGARIGTVDVSDDGEVAAWGDDAGNVWVRRRDHAVHELLSTGLGRITAVRLIESRALLASDWRGQVYMWRSLIADARSTVCDSEGVVTALAVSRRGETIACGYGTGRVIVSQPGAGTASSVWNANSGISAIDLSPDGEQLAIGQDDGMVYLLRIADSRAQALGGHRGRVTSVELSPTARRLASAGRDAKIRISNLRGMSPSLPQLSSTTLVTDTQVTVPPPGHQPTHSAKGPKE